MAGRYLLDEGPGLAHQHAGAEHVLLGAPGRQQGDDGGARLAPRVQHPALLVQSCAVPYEPMDAVEDCLPWSGRQCGVGQARPDIPWEIHLEILVGDFRVGEGVAVIITSVCRRYRL